jgi:hypothetical protein
MLDETRTEERLAAIPDGAAVFVSYLVGREPTDRAVREAQRARREGLAPRHFFGTLQTRRRTKRGELVFTVLCDNRDDERRGTQDGYRTFNSSLGTLLALEMV